MKIKTQDAFAIDIAEAPIQQLAPLTKQLAMSNRTARTCGTRWGTEKLEDIDFFATEGGHKWEIKDDEGKLALNIMRAGSTWTRVALLDGEFRRQDVPVMFGRGGNGGPCVEMQMPKRQRAGVG